MLQRSISSATPEEEERMSQSIFDLVGIVHGNDSRNITFGYHKDSYVLVQQINQLTSKFWSGRAHKQNFYERSASESVADSSLYPNVPMTLKTYEIDNLIG